MSEHPHIATEDVLRTPLRKAYEMNFSKRFLGSFAEIGAGQEVARAFFRSRFTSNTVAKTMSAYAMEESNDIYLENLELAYQIAYTSRYRLLAMLHHEHHLLLDRFIGKRGLHAPGKDLRTKRGFFPCLFSYANTISTGDAPEGSRAAYSGWMGVRVQSRQGGFSGTKNDMGIHVDLLAHVVLLEQDRRGQNETIGMMGVNMIDAACRLLSKGKFWGTERELVRSLFDGISKWKARVDVLEVNPSERHLHQYKSNPSNRELSLLAVQESLSHDTLLSSYRFPFPGEICSRDFASDYDRWRKDCLDAWHKKPDSGTSDANDWIYSKDGVCEPTRFLSQKKIHLVLAEVAESPEKMEFSVSPEMRKQIDSFDKADIFPLIVVPVETLPKIEGQDHFDLEAFEAAYTSWVAECKKSAILITRSNDLGWVVDSISRSLFKPEEFTLILDRKQWADVLQFDYAGKRKAQDTMIQDMHYDAERRFLQRELEQRSKGAIDCLQRIERVGCRIHLLCDVADGKGPAIDDGPLSSYISYLVKNKTIRCDAKVQ